MRRRLSLAVIVIGALALPAAAGAAPVGVGPGGTSAAVATASTAPPSAPARAARQPARRRARARSGALSLRVKGSAAVGARRYTLTHERLRVIGTMRPFMRRERVVVHVLRGRRRVRTFRVLPHASRTGRTGRFSVTVSSGPRGTLTVSAVHRRSRRLRRISARPVRVSVVGGNGRAVLALAQARLAARGYAVPQSGALDDGTRRALIAFRKVNGMARVPVLSRAIMVALLRGRGGFHARFPGHGKHLEADLARQVLVELYGRRVRQIYVLSSGKPSTPTVLGSFRIYSKQPGTNSHGMVDSNYFIGGYAIHGYPSVPTYPASHGCLRVPIPNAAAILAWTRIGDRVDVYG